MTMADPSGLHLPPRAPWHLLATLRLDGCQKFERRVVIVLDEHEPAFHEPDGKIFLTHCDLMGPDGQLQEYEWVFEEVAVDKMLKRLAITGNEGAFVKETCNCVRSDDNVLGIISQQESEEKRPFGRIEVTLERVTINRMCRNAKYRPSAGEDTDIDVGHGDGAIKHSAVHAKGRKYSGA